MKKILLIEDDKFLVRIYKTKFAKEGIESVFIENGVHAVEVAKKEEPGLILLDLVMPGKDGFQVLRDLSQDDKAKSIPVVVLSALSSETDMATARGLGAKEYYVKSDTSIKEIVDVIKKYL